jgi:uncharacterized phage-associated protein
MTPQEFYEIDRKPYIPLKKKVELYKVDENEKCLPVNKDSVEGWTRELKIEYKEPIKITVFDVANYILKKKGECTTMKLHKLLYYCQAWSLVWDDAPLFEERIEAWANGPVIRNLFEYHRGQYSISKLNVGNPDALSDKQKETIDTVLDFYGDRNSQWLIDLTHMEDPWKNARKGLSQTERGNREISHASMAEYYSSL